MKKKLPVIVFILILVVVAVIIGVWQFKGSKTKFNDDSSYNGNTAGNLYNGGLFCEYDGMIYFANPSDGNTLYSMNADGSSLKKLSDDVATYINADENYIYYVRDNALSDISLGNFNLNPKALCRIDRKNGKNSVILDTDTCQAAALVGNYIYYLHYDTSEATTLYSVKIDGTEQKQVSKTPYSPCGVCGQYIYYSATDGDYSIMQRNTATGSTGTFYSCSAYEPIVLSTIETYYLDVDHSYRLTSLSAAGDWTTVLVGDRVDCYNISDNYIYFQRNGGDGNALCRIAKDGSGYTVILNGTYTDINIVNGTVYFKDYYSGEIYQVLDSNPGYVTFFNP